MERSGESRVFLDGKRQMVETLRAMPPADRLRILRSLSRRSPVLARDLGDGSAPFEDVAALPPGRIRAALRTVPPAVLGIALKGMDEGFQRSVLSALDRGDALASYAAMTRPVPGEESRVPRARDKVLEAIGAREG